MGTEPDDGQGIASAQTWSVALSGGGHRSAMFGLGAVLSLVESGLGPRIASIASVSGGSLTNGMLVQHVDLGTAGTGTGDVDALAPLIAACDRDGSVQWAPAARRLVITLVGAVLAQAVQLVRVARRPSRAGAAQVLLLAATVLAVFNRSGPMAERIFERRFFSDSTTGRPVRMTDLPDRVTHVFCTTDLVAGEHLYVAQRFAHGTAVGHTSRPTLTLARAVQLSANFPLFAARRFSSRELGFSRPSRSVLLTDGGVFDNMGDEWARRYWERVRDRSERVEMGRVPEQMLVVNGSASLNGRRRPLASRVPLLDLLWAFLRDGAVLFDQTTAARRHGLIELFDLAAQLEAETAGPAVYGSATSASEASVEPSGVVPPMRGTLLHLNTPATWPIAPGYRCPRVVDPDWFRTVQEELHAWSEHRALTEAAARTAAVPTVLHRLQPGRTADMLAMVNLRVFFHGAWRPLPRQYFVDAVQRARQATPRP